MYIAKNIIAHFYIFFCRFGVHYECPVVALSSVTLMSWLATMTGNPQSIATVPNIFTSYTTHMTLRQRVVNTLIALMQEIMGK